MNEKGNALFLILIAVALFAALSYAVTNSGRGGSGIDKERADILAAQIMQEISMWQSHVQRLKIVSGYDQVLFNDSAPTDSGTCYSGDTTVSPCKTIGLFSQESGLSAPFTSKDIQEAAYYTNNKWNWGSRQYRVNGSELGTVLPDIIINIDGVVDTVCEALNKRLNGVATASSLAVATGSYGVTIIRYTGISYDLSSEAAGSTTALVVPYESGCFPYSGRNVATFPLEIH